MKSFTNQFISDLYGSILHVETSSLSGLSSVASVYDGLGNQTSFSVGLSGRGATITGSLTSGNIIFPQNPSFIQFVDYIYPVGSCLLTLSAVNPQNRFIGTTWIQVGQGLSLAGVGTGTDSANISATILSGVNQGLYQQTLSSSNIPDHYHYIASDDEPALNDVRPTANDYIKVAGRNENVSQAAYNLAGTDTPPTLGRTSGVANQGAPVPITTTNPTYGVYIWIRTS
jgi:hypothetical protein